MDDGVTYTLLAALGALILFALYHVARIARGLCAAFLDRRGARAADAYVRALEAYEREVAALSTAEALARVGPVLAGAGHLAVGPPGAAPPLLAELGAAIRAASRRLAHEHSRRPGAEPGEGVREILGRRPGSHPSVARVGVHGAAAEPRSALARRAGGRQARAWPSVARPIAGRLTARYGAEAARRRELCGYAQCALGDNELT